MTQQQKLRFKRFYNDVWIQLEADLGREVTRLEVVAHIRAIAATHPAYEAVFEERLRRLSGESDV